MADGAVEYGLAVFALADLEKRGVFRGADAVAFLVDLIELLRLPFDLAAEQEIAAEALLHVGAVLAGFGHAAGLLAHQHGAFKQAGQVEQVLRAALGDAAAQKVGHGLRGGEVAGGEHDDAALAVHAEGVHFFKRGNVVHAGVGAGVGGKNHAFFQIEGGAVSHKCSPAWAV